MEKKNFITLVFGVIGGLLFSLGMCPLPGGVKELAPPFPTKSSGNFRMCVG